jgi:predicted lactoylglutathione lyase
MRSIIVSLPVANLAVSAAFFEAVGFAARPEPAGAHSACVVIDDNVRVVLIERDRFQNEINGDSRGIAGEFLAGLAVDSELEVDQILARAIAAGARPWPIVPEPGAYSGAFRERRSLAATAG